MKMKNKEKDIKVPELLSDEKLNLQGLKESCEDYVNKVIKNKEYPEDNDDEHFIFEAAIETFYGKDIFKSLNAITK